MTATRVFLSALFIGGGVAFAVDAPSQAQLVSTERMADVVDVRNVSQSDGTVTGTVVNRSSHPIRNVRLRVDYLWLWNDEMHPGNDQYSRVDTYTLPGEIAPGESRTFTYAPSDPPTPGPRGRFTAVVQPTEVTELMTATAAPPYGEPSTTSGARPAESNRPTDSDDERIRPPY